MVSYIQEYGKVQAILSTTPLVRLRVDNSAHKAIIDIINQKGKRFLANLRR